MKVNVKKDLCVLNTVLSFVAYSFLHALAWLGREGSETNWLYVDNSTPWMCIVFFLLAFTFYSIFWNPAKSRILYFIGAVANVIFATVFAVEFILYANFDMEELRRTWKLIIATILYFAVSVLYFVMAFTKNKEPKKGDEPIPYSD